MRKLVKCIRGPNSLKKVLIYIIHPWSIHGVRIVHLKLWKKALLFRAFLGYLTVVGKKAIATMFY